MEQRITSLQLDDYAGGAERTRDLHLAPRCEPVQDLAWSHGGALLALVTVGGALLVLPKLGFPLPLKPIEASEAAQVSATLIPEAPKEVGAQNTAELPRLQRRLSMPICPVNLIFTKFNFVSTVSVSGGEGGSLSGSETAAGSALSASQVRPDRPLCCACKAPSLHLCPTNARSTQYESFRTHRSCVHASVDHKCGP
eukprot:SAG11_NODE_3145_length_2653_cov_1.712216_1_plen_197_part_00